MKQQPLTVCEKLNGKVLILIGLALTLVYTFASDICYVIDVELQIVPFRLYPQVYFPSWQNAVQVFCELLPILLLAAYVLGLRKFRPATLMLSLTFGAIALGYIWDNLQYIWDMIWYWEYYEWTSILYRLWDAGIIALVLIAAVTLPIHPKFGKIAATVCTVAALVMHVITCIDYLIWFMLEAAQYHYINLSQLCTLMWFDAIQTMYIVLIVLLCSNHFAPMFGSKRQNMIEIEANAVQY